MSNEQLSMNNEKTESALKVFWYGVLAGVLSAVLIIGVIWGFWFTNKRDKEIFEYAERQIEIEGLREDIINRPADVFLEVPDVRRAADGAAAEFDRKRDEILERYRSRFID
jgi:hypothetical protein